MHYNNNNKMDLGKRKFWRIGKAEKRSSMK